MTCAIMSPSKKPSADEHALVTTGLVLRFKMYRFHNGDSATAVAAACMYDPARRSASVGAVLLPSSPLITTTWFAAAASSVAGVAGDSSAPPPPLRSTCGTSSADDDGDDNKDDDEDDDDNKDDDENDDEMKHAAARLCLKETGASDGRLAYEQPPATTIGSGSRGKKARAGVHRHNNANTNRRSIFFFVRRGQSWVSWEWALI